MSKMKAVVLEKSGTRYTVLGMDGTFRHVKRRVNAEVGEEIELNVGRDGFWDLRVWVGVVALFLMVLTTLVGWNLYQAPTAVALVSVDINPSLEFTLDSQGRLLKLQTQNEDARKMLGVNNLKGKPIDEVLEKIVTLAYNQNYINPEHHWIVVGYSPITNKSLEIMPKELNEIQISTWVTETIEKKGFTPQVAVFTLTPQEKELARKGDLTLGEFALWQTAQKAGVTTQPEKLKDTSERVRLLENPQVQALVKTEKKGLATGLPRTPGTSMEKPRALGNPNKEGTGEPIRDESHFPIGTLNFVNEKGRETKADEKNQLTEKENGNDNDKNKESDRDKDKDNHIDKDNNINDKRNHDEEVSEKEKEKEQAHNNTKEKDTKRSSK